MLLHNGAESCAQEVFHRHFLRRLLGVSNSTTSFMVLGEFGRYPQAIFWAKAVLKYYARLTELPPDRLVADAFHHLLQQRGSTSWLHHVHSWLACLQSQDIVTAPGSDGTFGFSVDDVLAKLKCRYLADIHTQPSSKALTYWQIRGTIEYKYQTYLSTVQNKHHRRALARFRVGSHWLQVHRLASCGVPHEQRWCTFCSQSGFQILDDEDHSIYFMPSLCNPARSPYKIILLCTRPDARPDAAVKHRSVFQQS